MCSQDKIKGDRIVSADTLSIGIEIEEIISKRTNNLAEQNHKLKADILEWYSKTGDPNFKDFFGISV